MSAASLSDRGMEDGCSNVAVIFGVTGLVGRELARRLVSSPNWKVYGVARRPEAISPIRSPTYHFISCDLLDRGEAGNKLSALEEATHVFWLTWASNHPLDTEECCEQNRKMLCNALDVLVPIANALRHVSLQTGMKHYVSMRGPFDMKEACLYDEECERVRGPEDRNFYYALEDCLKDRLAGRVAWSVIRPGLLTGTSVRTPYNVIGSLCVYAAICKHLALPFVFGGNRKCWEEAIIDGSDARMVAEQHIWAARNEEIASTDGQAFNAINGPSFAWKDIWPSIAEKLGVELPLFMHQEDFLYTKAMSNKEHVWQEIVIKHGLLQTEVRDLANWDFLDALFRCPVKLLGSRAKGDHLGFTMRCETLESVMYCIDSMREEKLIPLGIRQAYQPATHFLF